MGQLPRTLVIAMVVMLAAAPLLASANADAAGAAGGDRGSWTVQRFIEGRVPLKVSFEASPENSTYHLSVPNTATITSASMTVEGVERYSLKGTPNDFDDPVGHKHQVYYGQIGIYPPAGFPSNYENVRWDPRDEDAIRSRDGTTYQTSTPFMANPPNYPYHQFDMVVNTTGMVRLKVEWHGWGFCVGNDTNTAGVQAYLFNHTSQKWFRFATYANNDTQGTVRSVSTTLMDPSHFADNFGHVHVLVFGQHDEPQGGGFTDVGSVASDYVAVTVLRNDTLQRPNRPSLAIGEQAAFWSEPGEFTGSMTLGDGSGFKEALQAFVDGIPPAAPPLEVPFRFRMAQATWAQLRVSSLSVTIREVDNQPPLFLGAEPVAMTEDTDLSRGIDLRDHFDDDHNGNDLAYSVEFEENASLVHAVIHPDGHSVNFLAVAPHWAGELEFRFNATDVWGLSTVSGAFTVTVEEVNDPPDITDPGALFIDEDMPFELNLTVVDPDIPYGDHLSFEDDSPMFDIDPATGRVAFTPDQDDVGLHNVTFVVRDSRGEYDSVRVPITVTDTNDPPVILDPGLLTAEEDAKFDFNFTATDEDGTGRFTWVLVGGVGTMNLGPLNGRLTWIPTGEHVGLVNISVIAMDNRGAATQVAVSIQVLNVNDPPVLEALRRVQLTEGVRFAYTVSFTDADLDETTNEEHTITLDPPLFPVSPVGAVDFTPANEHVGTHTLLVTITDSAGATDTAEWEVVVDNVNERPAIEQVEAQFWREDEPVHLQIMATDPDKGDVLTFSDSTSIFDIDPRTGVIDFTPVQQNVGTHQLRIVVADSGGLSADVYLDVTIAPFNDPPSAGIRVVTLKERLREGDMLSLAAEAEDPDNQVADLYFVWTMDGREVGDEATLDLDDLRPGNHTVVLRVSDGEGYGEAVYTFSVEDVEEPFSWTWAVLLAIGLVVAVLAIKAFQAIQDPGGGKARTMERPSGKETPEEPAPQDDGTFEGWRR